MDRAKVVEWVQKLMTKAADPAATEPERDACQSKAIKFMVKYKIEEMEAITPDKIKGHEMARENVNFFTPGKANWGYHLAWGIGPIFECKVIRQAHLRRMSFCGYPEDVATCVYFFRVLQLQIVGAIDTSSYRTVKDKNSYAEGMIARIRERLDDVYHRVKEIVPADTKELIVLKNDAVKKFYTKEFPSVHNANLKSPINNVAFGQGYVDGKHVNIAHNEREKVGG